MNCDCAGKFFSAMVHCVFDPCYESLALMFTKIYVHVLDAPHTFRERTYAGVRQLLDAQQTTPSHVTAEGAEPAGDHVTEVVPQFGRPRGHHSGRRYEQSGHYQQDA